MYVLEDNAPPVVDVRSLDLLIPKRTTKKTSTPDELVNLQKRKWKLHQSDDTVEP